MAAGRHCALQRVSSVHVIIQYGGVVFFLYITRRLSISRLNTLDLARTVAQSNVRIYIYIYIRSLWPQCHGYTIHWPHTSMNTERRNSMIYPTYCDETYDVTWLWLSTHAQITTAYVPPLTYNTAAAAGTEHGNSCKMSTAAAAAEVLSWLWSIRPSTNAAVERGQLKRRGKVSWKPLTVEFRPHRVWRSNAYEVT